MLKAPPTYNEEFYRNEIDGQKRRLQRLKERFEARKERADDGETRKMRVEQEKHQGDAMTAKE